MNWHWFILQKEGKEKSVIYEDDGYDYKKKEYSFLSFKMTGKKSFIVHFMAKEGKYDVQLQNIK
jgi:hypothetical protein